MSRVGSAGISPLFSDWRATGHVDRPGPVMLLLPPQGILVTALLRIGASLVARVRGDGDGPGDGELAAPHRRLDDVPMVRAFQPQV